MTNAIVWIAKMVLTFIVGLVIAEILPRVVKKFRRNRIQEVSA